MSAVEMGHIPATLVMLILFFVFSSKVEDAVSDLSHAFLPPCLRPAHRYSWAPPAGWEPKHQLPSQMRATLLGARASTRSVIDLAEEMKTSCETPWNEPRSCTVSPLKAECVLNPCALIRWMGNHVSLLQHIPAESLSSFHTVENGSQFEPSDWCANCSSTFPLIRDGKSSQRLCSSWSETKRSDFS